MIITKPFQAGSNVQKDETRGHDGALWYDYNGVFDLTVPGSYELGEQIYKPIPIQKGDRIHALPWSWTKYSVSNQDVFIHQESGMIARNRNVQRIIDNVFKVNVTPHIVVSKNLPHTVPGLPDSLVEFVKTSAILKAQANLNKQVASLPLLFVERKAVLKTAKRYSTSILNDVIKMQRKDVKKWLTAIKKRKRPEQMKVLAQQIANRHLEFVFGVLPLLSEIEDSVKHFSEPRVNVRTGRGRERRIIETESYSEPVTLNGGTFGRYPVKGTIVTVTKADFSTRCDLRCNITSHVLNDASLLGFNPLYTWYDLTPLSFVVGWFSNFNTWIQALDPLVGLEYVTGSSSHKDSKTVSRHIDAIKASLAPISGDINPYNSAGPAKTVKCSVSYDSFVREVHSEMPGLQSLRLVDRTSFFTYAASVSLSIQRLVRTAENGIEVKPFKYRGKKPRFLKSIKYKRV